MAASRGTCVSMSSVMTKRMGNGSAPLRTLMLVPAVAAQQTVEFVQLAALAFPAHPAALRGVPLPAAMEQEKPFRTVAAIFPIQLADPLQRSLHVGLVRGHVLRRGVGKVGQQGPAQVRVRIAQVVDLESIDQLGGAVRMRQHGRHDHAGGKRGRDAVLEVELGQHAGRQEHRDQVVHQADRQLAGRQESDEPQGHQDRHAGGPVSGQPQEQAEKNGEEQEDAAEIHQVRRA